MHIEHIALYCLDLEEMRRFFEQYFACRANELYHNPRTGLKTYILTFPDGGARLELMTRPEVTVSAEGSFRVGFVHLSIAMNSREAVDRQTKRLESAGFACLDGPRTTGDGYYESCIQGPEGILLELTI